AANAFFQYAHRPSQTPSTKVQDQESDAMTLRAWPAASTRSDRRNTASQTVHSPSNRYRVAIAIGWVLGMTLLFIQPLAVLLRHPLNSELHSYVPLIPLVTCYLLYARPRTRVSAYSASIGSAIVVGAIAMFALGAKVGWNGRLSVNDELAL